MDIDQRTDINEYKHREEEPTTKDFEVKSIEVEQAHLSSTFHPETGKSTQEIGLGTLVSYQKGIYFGVEHGEVTDWAQISHKIILVLFGVFIILSIFLALFVLILQKQAQNGISPTSISFRHTFGISESDNGFISYRTKKILLTNLSILLASSLTFFLQCKWHLFTRCCSKTNN